MRLFEGRNVNDIYPQVMQAMEGQVLESSRAGSVYDLGPACITYREPYERVLFDSKRDANPWFHLFEALWMLAGREDVEFISQFNKGMRQYSDDGETFHGAYGHRWRNFFSVEQPDLVAKMIREERNTRRAYLGIWDPAVDLGRNSKDIPCNVGVSFRVRAGNLDMTVFNRSNDAIWGALGANAVHFSVLHEWVASAAGYPIGVYRQVTDSLHAYADTFEKKRANAYDNPEYPTIVPMIGDKPLSFMDDCQRFCSGAGYYVTWFFRHTVRPMHRAWLARQANRRNLDEQFKWIDEIEAPDWRRACAGWVLRRKEEHDPASD